VLEGASSSFGYLAESWRVWELFQVDTWLPELNLVNDFPRFARRFLLTFTPVYHRVRRKVIHESL